MRQSIAVLVVLIFAAFSRADEPRQTSSGRAITEEQALKHNLIANDDFEIDADQNGVPDDWSTTPSPDFFSLDKTAPFSGRQCWKISGGGVRWLYGESNSIPVAPNTPYTLIIRIRQESPPAGEGSQPQICWTKTNGKVYTQYMRRIEGPLDWTKMVYVVQSPPDATSARIRIQKVSSGGTIWVDRVFFAQGMVKKGAADLTIDDRAKGYLTFDYLLKGFDRFLVTKEAFLSPALKQKAADLRTSLLSAMADFKKRDSDPAALEGHLKSRGKKIYFTEIEKQGLRPSMGDPWYADWKTLSTQVSDFKKQADQDIKANQPGKNEQQAKTVFGGDLGYGIGVTTTLQKVMKDQPYVGPIANQAAVALAKNEHEGFQVVVLPFKQDLKDVRITIGDLKTADGTVLKKEHVKAYPVGYVFCNDPLTYTPDYLGWWPDPLLVDKTFNAQKGENQPVWIDVYAPADQKAGVYKGEMVVTPANASSVTLELKVTVWNYALPKKGQFKVLGQFITAHIATFYKWKELPKDVELKWNLFQVEHRYSSTGIYRGSLYPNGEILEECLKAGLNTVNVGNFSGRMYDRKQAKYVAPTEEQKKAIQTDLKQGIDELKKLNAMDTAYIYCFDEVHDRGAYPMIADICNFVKAAFPEAKIATTTAYPPIADLIGSVDTWVPLLGTESEEIEQRKKAGDEVFFYIYGDPRHPFPNASLIEYPALDGRISFWIAWQKGWTGFLHWRTNGFEPNYKGEKRWPEIPWIPAGADRYVNIRNGEGYFIYPGPDGEPLSSVRFENMRDGIEDWEAMYILRDLAQKAAKLPDGKKYLASAEQVFEQIEKLVPNEYDYDMNPANLQTLRNQIARTIEQLQTAIDQKP